MAYTNKGLVEYAKKCVALGNDSIYLYGSFGQKLTQAFINQKAKQYVYNISRQSIYKKCMNSSGTEYAFDCVGLIKSYLWGGYGKVTYKASQDVSANGMYNKAKVKGDISTLPKTPGILVWMNGHIGISVGDGIHIIECTPAKKLAKQNHGGGGVCITKLTDRKWKKWCECPYITYETKKVSTTATKSFFGKKGYFSLGDSHENIGKIASFMYKTFPSYTKKKALGNYYGKNIQSSIKEFQKRTGLEADGSVGPLTLAKLKSYGFKA